ASQWNFATAAHLLNRAGFGGTPAEIEQLIRLGPDKAVARLVDFDAIPDATPPPEWAHPDPERLEKFRAAGRLRAEQQAELKKTTSPEERQALLKKHEEQRRKLQAEERRTQQEHLTELRGWWLERMAKGPRPLQEKLTLFWHGHFATSFQKVRDAYYMYLQNQTFRRNAAGNWATMLAEVTDDPAMLIWLDQASSDKRHPNENYAREVMELFALGEGHYTEKDILEAARALTGLTLDRMNQKATFRASMHDDGVKTVLGRTGNFQPKDVLDAILAQPQAARFIGFKLWRFFATENISTELVDALGEVFRNAKYELKPLLRAMFRSQEFYAPDVMRAQIKSPVQWLVGAARMLECDLPPARVTAPLLNNLGQSLFEPPNVKGWDGGTGWISTNTMLARYNSAAVLVMGPQAVNVMRDLAVNPKAKRKGGLFQGGTIPVKADQIITAAERGDKNTLIHALERRLIQDRLKDKQRSALRNYLESQADLDEQDILQAIRLVMCTPEFQLT
ncbi:MAG: DUF1800 domain-containing protein, partial [Verrucomicrobiota bacterium]